MGTLDEILATIRRLPVSERLRLIELATREVAEDTPRAPVVSGTPEHSKTLSVDELLATRLTPPPGVGPVTVEDMERAIGNGMSGHGSV